ncbi:MAG: hypothetical protein ACPHJD_03540 [Poseidonia sp.]
MLQRLLAEFLKLEGLHQALVIDDRGRLVSSVGASGSLPLTQQTVELTSAALDASMQNAYGDLHEVWIEGQSQTLIDVLTPHRILMLQGDGGQLARWRHSVDQLRKQLATTPEF